jgi:hypothetical protein
MIDFKKIELRDKEWIQPLLKLSDFNGCHQNFTNLFSWSDIYNYMAAKTDNFLVIKADHSPGFPYYFYPAGSGDLAKVIKTMINDAAVRGYEFTMSGLLKENVEQLCAFFPGVFAFTPDRDVFDYVYSVDKLACLAGNKLHSKRNHINYFKNNFVWSFEPITAHNLPECWDMTVKWCIKNGCKDDPELSEEFCSLRKCFKHYEELGLQGGILRSEGCIIAYTMGEKLNSDTYVTHIEKAFDDIRGAYQMINQQFAQFIKKAHPEIKYINREEDMGYEGLRKAKLSYYPDMLIEKYTARLEKNKL